MLDPGKLMCLLAISVVVLMACDKLGLSKIPCLVVASLSLAELHLFPGGIPLNPNVLLGLFLPALLYYSGLSITLRELKENALKIIALALVGTAITIALFSLGAVGLVGMTVAQALTLGAAASATDPPVMIVTMQEKEAPEKLAIVAELEALFNDGTGVTAFAIFSGMLAGEAVSITAGIYEFAHEAIFGFLFGAAIGAFFGFITSFFNSKEIEFALTLMGSYGVYYLSLMLDVSPVLAIVGSGIALRHMVDYVDGWSPEIENYVFDNWKNLSDFSNVLIFMLVGGHIGSFLSLEAFIPGVILSVVLFFARAVAVYFSAFNLGFFEKRMPLSWMNVLIVGGLHGGLGIALVLTLPESAMRELLLARLLWVVLISLVVQSAFIAPVLKFHKLVEENPPKKMLALLNEQVKAKATELKVWEEKRLEYAVVFEKTDHDETYIAKLQGEITLLKSQRDELLMENDPLMQEVIDETKKSAVYSALREVRRSHSPSKVKKVVVEQLNRLLQR